MKLRLPVFSTLGSLKSAAIALVTFGSMGLFYGGWLEWARRQPGATATTLAQQHVDGAAAGFGAVGLALGGLLLVLSRKRS